MALPIELKRVRKVYRQGLRELVALEGVDLKIQRGEMVALMGPSGSGKSTLLNLVAGLDTPDGGEVLLEGRVTSWLDDDALTLLRRRTIGLVFQFFNLLPSLTAAENVALPMRLEGVDASAIEGRAHMLLDQVGLPDRVHHNTPDALSGGEMQRVAIARALALDPPILLADEPTGNLDSHASSEILALLRRTSSELGRTVLMVTHDPRAADVTDRIVRLLDGHIEPESERTAVAGTRRG